jgi:hypothetical protein
VVACKKKKRKTIIPAGQTSGQSLRRSTGISKRTKGYKNRTILEGSDNGNAKSSKKRKIVSAGDLMHKVTLPAVMQTADFPGLADIEETETYPDISTSAIQEIAVNKCGISPFEVSTNILLDSGEDQAAPEEAGIGNKTQTLINE